MLSDAEKLREVRKLAKELQGNLDDDARAEILEKISRLTDPDRIVVVKELYTKTRLYTLAVDRHITRALYKAVGIQGSLYTASEESLERLKEITTQGHRDLEHGSLSEVVEALNDLTSMIDSYCRGD